MGREIVEAQPLRLEEMGKRKCVENFEDDIMPAEEHGALEQYKAFDLPRERWSCVLIALDGVWFH